jgi:hypothetical protein
MNGFVFTSFLFTAGVSVAAPCLAQERSDSTVRPGVSGDSATPRPSDSSSAYGDSIARGALDTAPSRASDSVARAPLKPPSDSTLVAACQSGRSGGVASQVLVVTFSADASSADRSKAAATVGGKLAGQAPSGEVYVTVPDSVSIRDAADQLIQAPGVAQIAERVCP